MFYVSLPHPDLTYIQNGERVTAGKDGPIAIVQNWPVVDSDGVSNRPLKQLLLNDLAMRDSANTAFNQIETGISNLEDRVANDEQNLATNYYTKNELNSSGGGGEVHWNNLTNVPNFNHNSLSGLQGGAPEYLHLSQAEKNQYNSYGATLTTLSNTINTHNHDNSYVKVFTNTKTEEHVRYLYVHNYHDFLRVNLKSSSWTYTQISPITITVRMKIDVISTSYPEKRGKGAAEVSWRVVPQVYTLDNGVTWNVSVLINEIYRVDDSSLTNINLIPSHIGSLTSISDNYGFTLFLGRTGNPSQGNCGGLGDFGLEATILTQYDSSFFTITPLSLTTSCP